MQEITLKSGWETLVIGVPLIGMLLIAFFRLDERFATSKPKLARERRVCGQDEDGEAIMTDPDGRRWSKPLRRR
jgi:hypothetical protein